MVPGIPNSVTDAVIGRNTCEMAVNVVSTGLGLAGNTVAPIVAHVVTYALGEGVKALVCDDQTAAQPSASVAAQPIDIKPLPNAPNPPPVAGRASRGPACPTTSSHRGGTCGLY
jgi:hypothetical protein